MAFWNRGKNWEDEYDQYYAQDRRTGPAGTRTVSRLRFFTHMLTLMFVGAVFLGIAGMLGGPTMLEKMLTDLAMPTGLVWLTLLVMTYFCLLTRQAWPALVGFACWLVLTIAGNSFVSNWLISTLERPYQDTQVLEMEPVDTIVVLGGGTSSRLTGGSQLAASGDRVATAARLFHAGKAKNLICTGSAPFQVSELDLDPRQEAAEILIGLGVPPANVVQMKGNNTSEEMQNLKTWIESNPNQGRIGILTSAWHLNRVMRLAESYNLKPVPIPSDFRTQPYGPSPNLLIPSSDRIQLTRLAVKEYLAGLVGR